MHGKNSGPGAYMYKTLADAMNSIARTTWPVV